MPSFAALFGADSASGDAAGQNSLLAQPLQRLLRLVHSDVLHALEQRRRDARVDVNARRAARWIGGRDRSKRAMNLDLPDTTDFQKRQATRFQNLLNARLIQPNYIIDACRNACITDHDYYVMPT